MCNSLFTLPTRSQLNFQATLCGARDRCKQKKSKFVGSKVSRTCKGSRVRRGVGETFDITSGIVVRYSVLGHGHIATA